MRRLPWGDAVDEHGEGELEVLFALRILDGPFPWVVGSLAIAAALVLLARRPTRAHILAALIGVLSGAVAGAGLYGLFNLVDAFGTPLPAQVALWLAAGFAGAGLAVANLRSSRWWRKAVAVVSVLIFFVAAGTGINALYGLDPTVGSLVGKVPDKPIALPPLTDRGTASAGTASAGIDATTADAGTRPLYRSWHPPTNMPAVGEEGTQVIRGSGFDARPAGIYLPPAALVAHPPALPLMIMMMGYPGNPDPGPIGAVMDAYAHRHDGLAPIVIVADQIGTRGDPDCADSARYGAAETYITTDVVAWAHAHLNVRENTAGVTIAGYSDGAACAFKYAAQYPQTFRTMIAVSPDDYPGVGDEKKAIRDVFGSRRALDEAKPTSILSAHPGRYRAVTAVFSIGGADPYRPGVAANAAAAARAGMRTTYYVVPGSGHGGVAITGGLTKGLDVLTPVLGLGR